MAPTLCLEGFRIFFCRWSSRVVEVVVVIVVGVGLCKEPNTQHIVKYWGFKKGPNTQQYVGKWNRLLSSRTDDILLRRNPVMIENVSSRKMVKKVSL